MRAPLPQGSIGLYRGTRVGVGVGVGGLGGGGGGGVDRRLVLVAS